MLEEPTLLSIVNMLNNHFREPVFQLQGDQDDQWELRHVVHYKSPRMNVTTYGAQSTSNWHWRCSSACVQYSL